MNKTLNITVGIIALVALVLGVVAFNKTPEIAQGVQGSQGERGLQGPKGDKGDKGDRGPVGPAGVSREAVGAVPTLDNVDNPYMSINGFRAFYYNQNMAATSSVPCSVHNPFGATSTVDVYTARTSVNGIGTAINLYLSTSTTAFGTSTPELVRAFPTGTGQFSMIWTPNASTTNTLGSIGLTGASNIILGPSEYLNLKLGTSSPGTFSSYYTGTCKGVIRAL